MFQKHIIYVFILFIKAQEKDKVPDSGLVEAYAEGEDAIQPGEVEGAQAHYK
jgi:hypothetical protein